jgi:hypothetical protein
MAVKTYHHTSLKFDPHISAEVGQRRAGGESISAIAKALKMSAGRVAMAELLATTDVVIISDPAKLAQAIVKDRKAHASWGLISARYLITEGTARAAFTAASGQPFTTLDFRKASKPAQVKAKAKRVVARKRTTVKVTQVDPAQARSGNVKLSAPDSAATPVGRKRARAVQGGVVIA